MMMMNDIEVGMMRMSWVMMLMLMPIGVGRSISVVWYTFLKQCHSDLIGVSLATSN